MYCRWPKLNFFSSIPLALFSINNSSKKYLAACFSSKGVADFISFFETVISLSNCLCPSDEDLNGAMWSFHVLRTAGDLHFVLPTTHHRYVIPHEKNPWKFSSNFTVSPCFILKKLLYFYFKRVYDCNIPISTLSLHLSVFAHTCLS